MNDYDDGIKKVNQNYEDLKQRNSELAMNWDEEDVKHQRHIVAITKNWLIHELRMLAISERALENVSVNNTTLRETIVQQIKEREKAANERSVKLDKEIDTLVEMFTSKTKGV